MSSPARIRARHLLACAALWIGACGGGGERGGPDAGEARLRHHVAVLASPAFEGRATGSVGEALSARYIRDVFRKNGLEPAGGGGYRQRFDFVAGVDLAPGNTLRLERAGQPGRAFVVDRDYRPLAFSKVGGVDSAPLLFGGYGFAAPGHGEIAAVDPYGGADLDGAWVLVLRGLPTSLDESRQRHWTRYSSLRYKAILARERGAAGILFVNGPASEARESLVALRLDGSAGDAGLAALSLTDRSADALVAASGRELAALQAERDQALARGEALPALALADTTLSAQVVLDPQQEQGMNVIARLGVGEPDAPVVVIGAHYDHLGRGLGGRSLARDAERGDIHHGADDNASGVAALLEIARILRERTLRGEFDAHRDIVFAAWSGEELGLLGSHHYVDAFVQSDPELANPHGAGLASRVAANLNLDMVGRLGGRDLLLQGAGTSEGWTALVEPIARAQGLAVEIQRDAFLPTDAASFVTRGVPVLSAFSGAHGEYHTPRDTPERLDYDGLARVTRFFAALAADLSVAPETLAFTAPEAHHGRRRARLRAYLGTIPDYAASQDGQGLTLSGVVAGGPAESAGLRSGDVIRSLAGRRVGDVYDYTYAIESLIPGREVEVIWQRAAEEMRGALVPVLRD